METENERLYILNLIEQGEISASEGLSRLQALSQDEPDTPAETVIAAGNTDDGTVTTASVPPDISGGVNASPESTQAEVLYGEPVVHATSTPAGVEKWKKWWTIPLWVGTGVTVIGSLLMFAAFQTNGIGFWFLCAGVPFTMGIILMIIGVQSRTAKWLHVRVQQKPGESPQRIAFSLPLPIRLSVWFFRTFGRFIPALNGIAIDQIIMALNVSASPENPVYISVDEGDQGEKVEIYIG